jgi:hypothetical protein
MINIILRTTLCLGLVFCVFGVAAVGGTNPTTGVTSTLYWRENGTNYSAELLVGDVYIPGDTGWCGSVHLTEEGHRFLHVHVTSWFPYYYGQTVIDASMVDAYWDWKYDGYIDCGGLSQVRNCYGYATLHSTWVDGIDIILADEYEQTDLPCATIVKLSGHMKKITGYFGDAEDVTDACWTAEKDRDSGIYELYYLLLAWPNPDPETFPGKTYTPDCD